MKGKLYIDGRDAFEDYGLWVEQGGYNDVVKQAAFKPLDTTDWPDEDGVEVDLENPVLDKRTITLQFCMLNVRFAEDLFDSLSTGAYHEFNFAELGKVYRLRMVSNGSLSQYIRLGKLSITFVDDFPTIPSRAPYPMGVSRVRQVGYKIDGVDISRFGAYVLRGSDESIRKAPIVKENLTISSKTTSGAEYDDENVNYKSKDVTLKMLIDAESIREFWRRYESLFDALMKPGNRVFFFGALNAEYDCYYKSSSVSRFEILRNGRVWCEFDVVLTFPSTRPTGQYGLLMSELLDYIITQSGEMLIVRPQ